MNKLQRLEIAGIAKFFFGGFSILTCLVFMKLFITLPIVIAGLIIN